MGDNPLYLQAFHKRLDQKLWLATNTELKITLAQNF